MVKQTTGYLWIIRWVKTGEMECMSGTKEEVRAYAEKKSEKKKSGYVIL